MALLAAVLCVAAPAMAAPAQLQFSEFSNGQFIDVCGTAPCHTAGWKGP